MLERTALMVAVTVVLLLIGVPFSAYLAVFAPIAGPYVLRARRRPPSV